MGSIAIEASRKPCVVKVRRDSESQSVRTLHHIIRFCNSDRARGCATRRRLLAAVAVAELWARCPQWFISGYRPIGPLGDICGEAILVNANIAHRLVFRARRGVGCSHSFRRDASEMNSESLSESGTLFKLLAVRVRFGLFVTRAKVREHFF